MREKCWPRNVTRQRPDTQHTTPSLTHKHTHKQVRVKHNIQVAGVKSGSYRLNLKWPVLWIRDILERIQIRGSVPITSDPDPAQGAQDAKKRFLECTFTSVFNDKK
jgi:hypothetical protein